MLSPDFYLPPTATFTKEKRSGWGMHIPDKSMVTSQMYLGSQRVQIHYAELEQYFVEVSKQNTPLDIVRKGAASTVSHLSSGAAQWEEIVRLGKDREYSLGQAMKEGANSCFHRGIFFQLLMQQAGIACTTVEGMWFEKEKAEAHVWNLVQLQNETYLVDTACRMEKDGEKVPIIHKIDEYIGGQEYFAVALPAGGTRKYVVAGKVKVSPSV